MHDIMNRKIAETAGDFQQGSENSVDFERKYVAYSIAAFQKYIFLSEYFVGLSSLVQGVMSYFAY